MINKTTLLLSIIFTILTSTYAFSRTYTPLTQEQMFIRTIRLCQKKAMTQWEHKRCLSLKKKLVRVENILAKHKWCSNDLCIEWPRYYLIHHNGTKLSITLAQFRGVKMCKAQAMFGPIVTARSICDTIRADLNIYLPLVPCILLGKC